MAYVRRCVSPYASYDLNYAIVWAPYYKRPVLLGEVATRLNEIIVTVCKDLNVKINKLDIQDDRVILFLTPPPSMPIHHLVIRIKYASSKTMRQEFPALKKRLPTLWNRAYYCATLGEFDEVKANEFCLQQKKQYR